MPESAESVQRLHMPAAVAGNRLPGPVRQARGGQAAVASGCAESDGVLLEGVHVRALAGQV
ncbi:hypothetical protein GCM10010234_10010 [Streptomyces hawaiiensis]